MNYDTVYTSGVFESGNNIIFIPANTVRMKEKPMIVYGERQCSGPER
jgi:hypothetical protein